MVVEHLTFDVPVEELHEWLRHEEVHWSRFLERQDGFVRKEMWRSIDDPTKVHAVIWWESMAQWKAIPGDDLARVAAAMGEHERSPACEPLEVIRDC